jgi:hypothetical protein
VGENPEELGDQVGGDGFQNVNLIVPEPEPEPESSGEWKYVKWLVDW